MHPLRLFAWLAICVTTVPAFTAEEKPVNLLRLRGVRVERTTLSPAEAKDLGKWIDGDSRTTATVSATQSAPVEIVFTFPETTVSVEKVSIRLASTESAPRLEVLASTVSATGGFQVLRADNLRGVTTEQVFRFPQSGTRWLLVRLVPPEKGKTVSVAELECWGHQGPPRSRYAFKEAPAQAFTVLQRLKKLSALDLKLTKDEEALFADVQEGRFRTWSFAEAALLAEGVRDRDRRKKYLKQLDTLVEDARKATTAGKTPTAKGEALLRFLHKSALKKGYRANQTTLSGILDTETYNCVSSAVLFNVVAIRLGLDARAIEVPDHAFSVIYAGTRAFDVETTTARGFNPARDRDALRDFEKVTGFQYIPDRDRERRRELREAGLVAIICYNQGVDAAREKRYHEALMHNFRAMSLDREFASAVKNALAVLATWGVELAREKKFKEGLEVLATGLELAPKDETLLHNRKVFWSQWADTLAEAGKSDEAVAILQRAIRVVPASADSFRSQLPWVFLRKGEALVKAGKWEDAHEAVAPGLKKLEGAPRDEIVRWQQSLTARWAASLRDKHEYDRAVALLARAIDREPTNDRHADSLCYTVTVWVRAVFDREGEAKALAILRKQVTAFPKVRKMQDVAVSHVYRLLDRCLQNGKPEEGVEIIDRHRDLITKADEVRDMTRYLIDRWARQRIAKEDYPGALDAYDSALKRLPGDSHLSTNRNYQMNEWVRQTHLKSGEAKAREVLQTLRKRYPKEGKIDDIARSQAQRVIDGLVDRGKHEAALEVIDRYALYLAREEKSQKEAVRLLGRDVYDRWARGHREKKEWQKAIDIYTRALERFPGDSRLENNAVFTWETWAATYRKDKNWDKAIEIYEKSLKQFPTNSTLKNNLEYSKVLKKKGEKK
jgi:tetratricopeptide (TPR) repeat protein